MSDSDSDVQLQPKLPMVVKKKPASSEPFVTEKPVAYKQTLLYQPPTAKHRLVACKITQVADEYEKMVSGGLKPLVYSLNVVKPRVIPGCIEVIPVYESRSSGNIQVDVIENKSGVLVSIGYCELFGLLASAKEAAEELKTHTRGVIVASTFNGDAARLFCSLVLGHIKSDKLRKCIKVKCAKPKAQVLRDFASVARGGDLAAAEAFYYEKL